MKVTKIAKIYPVSFFKKKYQSPSRQLKKNKKSEPHTDYEHVMVHFFENLIAKKIFIQYGGEQQ